MRFLFQKRNAALACIFAVLGALCAVVLHHEDARMEHCCAGEQTPADRHQQHDSVHCSICQFMVQAGFFHEFNPVMAVAIFSSHPLVGPVLLLSSGIRRQDSISARGPPAAA